VARSFTLIEKTTRELIPPTVILPGALWTIFCAFHYMHRTWRWYRWSKVYANPDNFFKLATGHALNFIAGDNIVLRTAGQCVLIATRILDCIEQQTVLQRSYHKWIEALKGYYPENKKWKWPQSETESWASPSTTLYFKQSAYNVTWRTRRIARRTFKLIKNMFKLSMMMMDAIEAFSLSPSTRNEAVSEIFVNSTKCLDRLVENKEELLSKLQNNKGLIGKILTGIGSPYHADHFILHVSNTLAATAKAQQMVNKVNQAANGVLEDLVKQGIFGFMATLGLAKYTPHFLVPALHAPWEQSAPQPKEYGRYAPVHWVTRITDLQQIPPIELQRKIQNQSRYEKIIVSAKPIKYRKTSQRNPTVRLPPRSSNEEPPPYQRQFKPTTVQQALQDAIAFQRQHNTQIQV
jgi:hypothetical protein